MPPSPDTKTATPSMIDHPDTGSRDAVAMTEARYAEVLAGVLDIQDVPVHAHFFDDLDTDSLVMARFCARVRKRPELPPVSMKDIYRHPTLNALATALTPPHIVRAATDPATDPATVMRHLGTPDPSTPQPSPPAPEPDTEPVGTLRYLLCGALQMGYWCAYALLLGSIATSGYQWIADRTGPIDRYLRATATGGSASAYTPLLADPGVGGIYLRATAFSVTSFVFLSALPIVAKWVLIGRWRPCEIRIWSTAYFWFWVVKTLIRTGPLALFAGSPVYVLYLRALGAKVGTGATILSRTVPVCTDLLTIGAGTIIRKDTVINCYRARGGVIQIGPVTIGEDVLVSEATVLDIGCSMGHASQLGHASSLHTGQHLPAGTRWHGSPAQPTDVDYSSVGAAHCGTLRRAGYSLLQLTWMAAVTLPIPLTLGVIAVQRLPLLATLAGEGPVELTGWEHYRNCFAVATIVSCAGLLLALAGATTVPRLIDPIVKPDRVYRLYGLRYWLHRGVGRMTNIATLNKLFGDTSYIVDYLRHLGYRLTQVHQTGSNFGTVVKHDNPYLSAVGGGTMVADGLSIINTCYSSTSFTVTRIVIGGRSFLGNNIAYPAHSRVGDNCLLGTKVMVPIDGDIRTGVGLLGSPSFEIPRSVDRDTRFDLVTEEETRGRLAAKNRHNIATIALFLATRLLYTFGMIVVVTAIPPFYASLGAAAVGLDLFLASAFTVAFGLLIDRLCRRLMTLAPDGCSIYDKEFWRHERFWKVPLETYMQVFNGTPFKSLIWRLLGVNIGAKVFDDGCAMPERSFVTIGDHCTLNAGSVIQCHSQEDGAFKSARSTMGIGCTLGVNAFVHYDVTICDGAILEADSFLMKGEQVPAMARWTGNPAAELRPGAPATPHTTTWALPDRYPTQVWPLPSAPAPIPVTTSPNPPTSTPAGLSTSPTPAPPSWRPSPRPRTTRPTPQPRSLPPSYAGPAGQHATQAILSQGHPDDQQRPVSA